MSRAKIMRGVSRLVVTALLAIPLRAAVPSEEPLLTIAMDPQAGVVERTRAFAELRAVATDRSIPALVALLEDRAWAFSARSVLETMPGPAADRALLQALETTDDVALRAGLVNSLGNREHAGAVPSIAKLLTFTDPVLAGAALNALGNIATLPAGEALAAYDPPADLRSAWADAALRAAEALRRIDRSQSLELHRRIAAIGAAPQTGAALMAVAPLSDQPVAAVTAALTSERRMLRESALAEIRAGRFGPELTAAVARIFPSLPPDVQVQVLSVYYDSGDRASAPVARSALAATDAGVRAAAAKLLSAVGEAADAPALLRMMTGPEEPAPSARLALTRIRGEETTDLLLETFRTGGEAGAAALDVLVSRGVRAVVAELLRPEHHADDAASRAAANALLALGTGADLDRVLALHARLDSGRRGPLEGVLRRLASKHPSPDEAAGLVYEAAEKLPLAEGSPLFVMLAGIGGDTAFALLAEMLTSPVVDRRKAALRAFGNWRNIRPAPTLLAAAREDSDPAVRALAVRSATTLFAKSAFGGNSAPTPEQVPAAIEGLRRTWELAENAGERNAILAALKGLKDARANAVAEELERTQSAAK